MIDVVEILLHWHAGRPKSVIADSLRVDAKTVRKYVAPAQAAGITPGGPRLSRAEWAELVGGWFPELVDTKARSATFPLIEAFRERIATMLATNTATTVHQRLRDEDGLAVSLTSFRRWGYPFNRTSPGQPFSMGDSPRRVPGWAGAPTVPAGQAVPSSALGRR